MPCDYHTALVWLPYNSCVVQSNSHTVTVHGTNAKGGRGFPMWPSSVQVLLLWQQLLSEFEALQPQEWQSAMDYFLPLISFTGFVNQS